MTAGGPVGGSSARCAGERVVDAVLQALRR
jgi:hypothetical protein